MKSIKGVNRLFMVKFVVLLQSEYSLYEESIRQKKAAESGDEYAPSNDEDYNDDILME